MLQQKDGKYGEFTQSILKEKLAIRLKTCILNFFEKETPKGCF